MTIGPKNPLKVEVDDTALLNCHVDAKPSVSSVRWTRAGRFINTIFTHTIPRVKVTDAGSYICSADNGLGQVGKSELILDVQHAPVVTLPERREVKSGETVVVDCKVAANPRPTKVQWFKVGDENFSQTGTVLRINRVGAKDNGKYICSATNFVQPTDKPRTQRIGNATISINVHHKPGNAFIGPDRPTAVDGRSVTLRCGANPPGYPQPSYRWWRDGEDGKTMAVGSEFTIDSVRLSSAGKYYCQPENEHGEGTVASAYLDVYQAPKITDGLNNQITKRDGESGFQLSCSATGKPRPRVTWYKDGRAILDKESNVYQVTNSETETSNRAFNVVSVLKFVGPDRINAEQLMPTDRGHYTCQFENEVSSAETKLLLRIQHAPVVVHEHNKVAFNVREIGYINCRMQAFPEPSFDWSYKGSSLPNDRRYFQINRTVLPGDVYESTLKIFKVTEASYGEYTCGATNEIGPKKTKIWLEKKGKPEKPDNLRPVTTSYNFITLAWDEGFNGGYEDTKFTIEYRKQGGGGVPRYRDCGYDNPCNITNLEQHTQYYVRVKASNIKGESKFSPEAAVATKVDVALIPKPANVHYEKSTGKASFQVEENPLSLVAKIELENGDGTWSHYDGLILDEVAFAELDIDTPVVSNLRVRLCLKSNELLCGPYAEALIVDVRPNARTSAALQAPWMIVIIVVLLLLALVALFVLLRCFCCRGGKRMKNGTSDVNSNGRPTIVHHGTSLPPPSYTSTFGGIDNKAITDPVKDVTDDNLKAALFQSNGFPAPSSSGGGDHHMQLQSGSNTNSANGGSVNSQDSLWNVKNGSPGATATTVLSSTSSDPFYQNGYVPFDMQQHQQQMQQMQQQQQQQQQQQNFEDYTHYPYPDEYLPDSQRQYLAMTTDGAQPRHHSECKS